MPQTPGCCDTQWELLRKILLELLEMGAVTNAALYPQANDSEWQLWYKILGALGQF